MIIIKILRRQMMTKKQLVDVVAEKAGVTKKNAEAVISAALDEIVAAVANGESVQLIGFGTFEARKREARVGINPLTQEKIEIAASTVPAFKAGKAFKEAVK